MALDTLVIFGTVNFNGGSSLLTRSMLVDFDGVLASTSDVIVSDDFTWLEGTLLGAGKLQCQGTAEISGDQKLKFMDSRRLVMDTTAQWSGSGDILLRNGASLEVSSTGSLTISASGALRIIEVGPTPVLSVFGQVQILPSSTPGWVVSSSPPFFFALFTFEGHANGV